MHPMPYLSPLQIKLFIFYIHSIKVVFFLFFSQALFLLFCLLNVLLIYNVSLQTLVKLICVIVKFLKTSVCYFSSLPHQNELITFVNVSLTLHLVFYLAKQKIPWNGWYFFDVVFDSSIKLKEANFILLLI